MQEAFATTPLLSQARGAALHLNFSLVVDLLWNHLKATLHPRSAFLVKRRDAERAHGSLYGNQLRKVKSAALIRGNCLHLSFGLCMYKHSLKLSKIWETPKERYR